MSHVEVIARMKIRSGRLDAFKAQAAELLRLTREKDTQTLRYDSFVNETTMECEVHEAYRDEQAFMQHNAHIMEAREILFHEYADEHHIRVFGEVSPQLREFFAQFGGVVTVFSFLMTRLNKAERRVLLRLLDRLVSPEPEAVGVVRRVSR